MCKTALPLLLSVLLSSAAVADVVRHDSVPDSFWGTWNTTDGDRFVIELSAKSYANSEANCAVNWVSETPGASGPIYSARLQCSRRPEGTGGRFALNIIIWPKSSDEIAVGPDFMRLKIFRRCRATTPPLTGDVRSREAPLGAARASSQGECRIDGNR